MFGGYGRTEDELFKVITDAVRFRLMGLQLKVTPGVITAAEVWNFPIDRIYKYKYILDELLGDNMDVDDDGC